MKGFSESTLLIRADASPEIGTGHVMRMLALAQAWMERGGSVALASITCPAPLVERLQKEGVNWIQLKATELGSEADAEESIRIAKNLNAPWLVLDGYHFSYEYQRAVHEVGLKIIVLDDYGHCERWCADVIVNQNLDSEFERSYSNDLEGSVNLLGSKYCLLRKEFLKARSRKKEWKRIERLLVSLGGSDPHNATGATLELLNSAYERPLDIRVLSGVDNPHIEEIRHFHSHHNIEILTNITDMPAQFEWADGIISAGGSTCWEWLHAGLPGAIVTVADNQLPIISALTEPRRAALSLGWFSDFDSEMNGHNLADWINDPESQVDRLAVESLIDGYGSFRLAGILLGRKLMVRQALDQDCELYFNWANDPDVRKNAFSSEPISIDKHIKWFESRLQSQDSCLLLGTDLDGNPVGQIRFDYHKDRQAWVVDISTDKMYRGKGIGRQLIFEGVCWMRTRFGKSLSIEADVLDSNRASIKLFMSIGFQEIQHGDDFTSFRFNL